MTEPVSRPSAAERELLHNVLALDLGGTHLRTAVVTAQGEVVARRMSATPWAAEEVIAACVEQLRATRAEAEAAGSRPAALTISAPGPLDPSTGVLIDPPNLDRRMWNMPLAPRLSDALELPAHLERDTQVAALGEARFGAARGLTDFIYMTVSTGVGGAVVSAGRLLRGPDGVAGELGHISVDGDGPPCGCGARGHLEAFASGTGIAAAARRAWQAGQLEPGTPLERVMQSAGERVSGRQVAQAEDEGDEVAATILGAARRAFATAMVSIVDVFNPQRVIVGGGVATGQADRLFEPARELVARQAFRVQARRVEIVPAALGDDVGLLGGVGLAVLPRLDTGRNENSASGGTSDPGARGPGRMTLTADGPRMEHSAGNQENDRAVVPG